MKEVHSINNSMLLGFAVGLGLLTKATFAFYIFIPLGMLFFLLRRTFHKFILITGIVLFLAFVLQLRLLGQNYLLYGNFLGVKMSDKGKEAVYINEVINPSSISSNIIRNLLVHLPIPFSSAYIQNVIVSLHKLIGFEINDPRTTCCGTQFIVKSLIYPQEDIVANPSYLIIIITGGFFLVYKRGQLYKIPSIILYLLAIFSFIVFSSLIKW